MLAATEERAVNAVTADLFLKQQQATQKVCERQEGTDEVDPNGARPGAL